MLPLLIQFLPHDLPASAAPLSQAAVDQQSREWSQVTLGLVQTSQVLVVLCIWSFPEYLATAVFSCHITYGIWHRLEDT